MTRLDPRTCADALPLRDKQPVKRRLDSAKGREYRDWPYFVQSPSTERGRTIVVEQLGLASEATPQLTVAKPLARALGTAATDPMRAGEMESGRSMFALTVERAAVGLAHLKPNADAISSFDLIFHPGLPTQHPTKAKLSTFVPDTRRWPQILYTYPYP